MYPGRDKYVYTLQSRRFGHIAKPRVLNQVLNRFVSMGLLG